MNLYQLTSEIQALEAILDEVGDQADDSIIEALGGLKDLQQSKIDGLHRWCRNLKAEAEAYRAEAERLKEQQQAREAKIARLKGYLFQAVQLMGGKVDTTVGGLKIADNGGKQALIVPDAIEDVPGEYVKHVPTIDKEAVRKALESGIEVANCALAPRGKSLRGL